MEAETNRCLSAVASDPRRRSRVPSTPRCEGLCFITPSGGSRRSSGAESCATTACGTGWCSIRFRSVAGRGPPTLEQAHASRRQTPGLFFLCCCCCCAAALVVIYIAGVHNSHTCRPAAALQIVNKIGSKLLPENFFQQSMPKAPRAYWSCGSVLEAHRRARTERFWLA